MNRTAPSRARHGTKDPAAILRRVANGYRTGEIRWGKGFYCDGGLRCLLGGVAWAVDPADPDGDPFLSPGERATRAAIGALLDVLILDGDLPIGADPNDIGDWNDRQTSVDRVIAVCEAAAERAAGIAVPS